MSSKKAVVNNISSGSFEENIRSTVLSLVVDDEEDICFLLKNILQHKNINNVCVNNLADAECFLQSHDPAVIFLDNKHSDGLGIEHIRGIKEKHPDTRIVMITAHDNFREKALYEGADYFIIKPFSKKMILETLQNII